MTVRHFDGKKVASMCDTWCKACGRKSYVWLTGLCDGCSYRNDPELQGWVNRQMEALRTHGKA